jgi:hypothetical protein
MKIACWTLISLSLLGCRAESVGVRVERGGPQSLSADELRRDVWRWARAASGERAALVQQRLADMRWPTGPPPAGLAGAWCVQRAGRSAENAGGDAIWWSAEAGAPADADAEGLQWAALIALAKAIPDVPRAKPLALCAGAGPVAPERAAAALEAAGYAPAAWIGGLSGEPLGPIGAFGPSGQRYAEAAPRAWPGLVLLDAEAVVGAVRALAEAWSPPAPPRP